MQQLVKVTHDKSPNRAAICLRCHLIYRMRHTQLKGDSQMGRNEEEKRVPYGDLYRHYVERKNKVNEALRFSPEEETLLAPNPEDKSFKQLIEFCSSHRFIERNFNPSERDLAQKNLVPLTADRRKEPPNFSIRPIWESPIYYASLWIRIDSFGLNSDAALIGTSIGLPISASISTLS